MLRWIAIPVFALTLVPSLSLAADYSRVRCEDPHFMAYMGSKLPHLNSALTGASFNHAFADQQVMAATTVSAAPNQIVCEVTVNLSTTRGGERPVRGRFTTMQVGNGTRWHWQPGY